jgi:hypothetical protein
LGAFFRDFVFYGFHIKADVCFIISTPRKDSSFPNPCGKKEGPPKPPEVIIPWVQVLRGPLFSYPQLKGVFF